ncbi:MAG TPA: hypothetical protein VFL71_18115 [Actinomycetes bacterium]|nr:hypothetical protein [Actinomycetes bacterium]
MLRRDRPAWPRWWPAGLAWALWALAVLGLAAVPVVDQTMQPTQAWLWLRPPHAAARRPPLPP